MSPNNNSNALTKEQLFACLEHDGFEIGAYMVSKARNNDGQALRDIGYEYESELKYYPRAMAWYRLAAAQNNSSAYNNIGVLYGVGQGVSQDYLTAIEYYLKAARYNHHVAMSNIAFRFLNGQGVAVNKYKALEWFTKCRKEPEQVKKLNGAGIHIKKEDIHKHIYQLIIETYDITREQRMERESKLKEEIAELKAKESKSKGENEDLKKAKSPNEQEMENLRKEYQTLQIESQEKQQQILALQHEKELSKQSSQQQIFALEHEKELLKQSSASSEQHLKDKDEVIKALRLTTDTLQSLVQSKTNENNVLNKEIQRLSELEQTNRELNCKIQEYRKVFQESISLRDIVDYEIVSTNDSGKNKTDAIINTKDEENQKKRHYF